MAEKKSKALALELMDDLLNEDAPSIVVEVPPATKTVPLAITRTEIPDQVEPIDPTNESPRGHYGDATEISDAEAAIPSTSEPQDRTERVQPSQLPPTAGAEDRVRASVGRFAPSRSVGSVSATEAVLAQSESLRVAQSRLLELEKEIERLRLQNEELAAAGETLRRRTDELTAANQKRESDYQNLQSTFAQEKEILLNSKEALQRDLAETRMKAEELELRISTNIQKIRVRERELENRLELVKMESAALIRSKDEMILELKRNIDQLNLELNNYRSKNQELNRQTTDKQEQLRRTVKALRLALSMLEGEEEAPRAGAVSAAPATPQRKAK